MCGISHPLAGVVFRKRVKQSGTTLRIADYAHLGLEFEICARIGRDLPPRSSGYARTDIDGAVASVCAAVEVVDDRHEQILRIAKHTAELVDLGQDITREDDEHRRFMVASRQTT